MKAIVFGGSGFVGSHVADALSAAGHEVTVFDRRHSPYLGPGQRSQPYSGFKVQFTNGTSQTATNPQTRVLVDLQDREWRCQGYTDPASGTVVWEVADVTNHPLLIPAGQQVAVEILCRVPDVPLDTAQVRLQ